MPKTFLESLKNRRSYYGIKKSSPIPDQEIENILEQVLLHTPSAFNSQSTRLVLLLGEQSDKLWDIVFNTLSPRLSDEQRPKTKQKIESFKAGYGTVLYFEDSSAVEAFQAKFPSYADNFSKWSEQTAGMHLLGVWSALEAAGFGASIQHYNPLIDDEVKGTWNIDPKWRLIGQMPFGEITAPAGEKTFEPLEKRLKVFK